MTGAGAGYRDEKDAAAAGDVALRPAMATDLRPIRELADAEHGGTVRPEGGYPEAVDAYFLHLIEHGRVEVAESDGTVVGFGAAIASPRWLHLADLFVRPELQSRGIGRRLLEAVMGEEWPRTTFSSDDPRALPLYVRLGMRPLWPNLYLAGDGRRIEGFPRDLEIDASAVVDVAALERDWWGVDRPIQHAYWATQPEAVPLIVRRGGRPVAAGYARSLLRGGGRWINLLFVAPDAEPLAPTLAALRWSADAEGRIGGCLLGPHPAVPALIAAGFRVIDRDTYQASDPDLIDPHRRIVNTGFL
jgi:GNAT superfamily N-acetyltransferase